MRRRWPVLVLAAWTAFVWVTRINNAWADATATTTVKVLSTALALSMLGLAVVGVVVAVQARARTLSGFERTGLMVFAFWTIGVWAARAVQIVLADYSGDAAIPNPVAFKIVHVALGVVSMVLAALVIRMVRSEPAPVAGHDRIAQGTAEPATVSPSSAVDR